jgi:hypothetical protein
MVEEEVVFFLSPAFPNTRVQELAHTIFVHGYDVCALARIVNGRIALSSFEIDLQRIGIKPFSSRCIVDFIQRIQNLNKSDGECNSIETRFALLSIL